MKDELEGMTQARWDSLLPSERTRLAVPPSHPQITADMIGWRVEVVTSYGETRRFIIGKSTGWRPCYLEVKTRSSLGGIPVEREYQSVRKLYKAR